MPSTVRLISQDLYCYMNTSKLAEHKELLGSGTLLSKVYANEH